MSRFQAMKHQLDMGQGPDHVPQSLAQIYVFVCLLEKLHAAGQLEYLATPQQTLNDELSMQVSVISPWLGQRIAQNNVFTSQSMQSLALV